MLLTEAEGRPRGAELRSEPLPCPPPLEWQAHLNRPVCAREVGWPSQNQPTPWEPRSLLCTQAPGLCVSCLAVSGSLASPCYPPSRGTSRWSRRPPLPRTVHAAHWPCRSGLVALILEHVLVMTVSFPLFPQPSLPLSPLSDRLPFSSED